MATSIIKKAAKTLAKTDAPVDLSRRSLFKLPAVSEPSTLPAAPTPAPSGLEALERVAQAPVSRRDVLKSAAGQAARAVMPSGLEALAAPVARSVVGQATKTAASQSPMSLQALVIQQMSKELEKASARDLEFDPDRVVGSVVKKSGAPREDVQRMTYNLSDVLGASEYIGDFDEKLLQTGYDFMRPSEVLKSAFDIDPVANPSPFAIKPLMRDMKEKLPDQFYDQFKSGVRRMAEDKNDAFAEIYARGDESIGGMIDDTRKKYLSGQISRAEMEQVLGRIQAGHHESAQPARPRSAKSAATEEAIRDAERRYLAYEINHNQLLKILGPGVQQKVFRPGEIVWLDLNEDFARHHGFFDEDSARVKDVASDVAKVTYPQGRGVPHIVVPSKDKDWGGYTVKPLIGGMSKEKDNTYRVREFLPTNTQPTMADKELGRAVLRPDPYDEVEKASGGIIKKAAKAAVKELGEDVRIDRRNMFRFPQKDQPLMEIPKGAPTVTEKTLEVAPEGVKGEKVTKSVIDTPVSRRTVIKSAGSQLAQNVVPKAAPTPQLTAQELFGSAKSMPDLYASMLPLVRKVAPEELASMADRLGFTIDDIIAMSGEDLLPRGDLTMEGLTRFEELFPITASRVLKKAGGGIIKKATKAITKLDEPVDPARRSFFRLPESTNLPAPVAPPAPAPAVSGLGALEKAAQTPVSRRDVLKSAAGQAARAVMPSGLEALAAPVARSVAGEVVEQAAAPAINLTSPLAIVIKMLSEGKSADKVASHLGMDPSSFKFLNLLVRATHPSSYLYGDAPVLKRPSEALAEMIGMQDAKSPFALRSELRQLKQANPDSMKYFIESARGVSNESAELAQGIGLERHWIDRYLRGEIKYEDLPKRYQDEIDSISGGSHSYAGGGIIKKAAQAAAKTEPKEQRMLQGYYRGFSGDYDAQRAAQDAGMVFVTPQRPAGEYFANKRAKQTGLDPHLEMVLADPFVGYSYGLNIPIGPENKKVSYTKARQLKPEDVKSTTRLYAEGGPVAGAQFNEMVSNAMKNGMGEAEALRQLLPLFR